MPFVKFILVSYVRRSQSSNGCSKVALQAQDTNYPNVSTRNVLSMFRITVLSRHELEGQTEDRGTNLDDIANGALCLQQEDELLSKTIMRGYDTI
jgi:hypothetical protein